MPLSGQAMLVNFMNVAEEHERDFNRWYDREHLAERVAIPGFLEARRYVATDAAQKYLGLYTTETIEVLDSPAYRERLADQTPWSRANLARFRDATRACARVTASRGEGRGSALALLRLRPADDPAAAREVVAEGLDAALDLDGVVSVHLIESDPRLSVPLTESANAAEGSADWYALIDATTTDALAPAIDALAPRGRAAGPSTVSTGLYRLLWDLSRAEMRC